MKKTNLHQITKLYGRGAIAKHLCVSLSSVDKYVARGYLSNVKQMKSLGDLDEKFSYHDFRDDFEDLK